MERNSNHIQLDLDTAAQMLRYHEERAAFYRVMQGKYVMELNRARRLEREAKELQR